MPFQVNPCTINDGEKPGHKFARRLTSVSGEIPKRFKHTFLYQIRDFQSFSNALSRYTLSPEFYDGFDVIEQLRCRSIGAALSVFYQDSNVRREGRAHSFQDLGQVQS